ncbi:MAG: hypothetical protein Q9218_002118 [Villophora microphyllina]
MTTEAPDPKTFGSWEDAFQYPIATVRGMERQLRNDLDSNREKLRSLVGASYRDLLGTADTIIGMDGQMQKVESYLRDMGVRCNSRLLDRKATNLRTWTNGSKSKDRDRYAFASQLAVLRSCPEVISRLLKREGSALPAAKVLVISRLLHKKLSESSGALPYLEVLRNRLAALRRKLLARIDRQFQSLESSESTLVQAMCAFSLATSSSPSDLLRHFHHLRQRAISELGYRGYNDSIFESLKMTVQTLRDSQAIFPDRLARSLEELKTLPLMHALDLQSQQALNLVIHQRWLGEDITNFVPYIRHDDLQKLDAIKVIKQWAKQAFSSFFKDLGKKLEATEDPATLLHLRQEMLELWFANQRHATGVGPSEVLEGIRTAFTDRLQDSIHQCTTHLGDVASTLAILLKTWESGVSNACPHLWGNSICIMNGSSGSKTLKEALSIRAYGRTEPVRALSAAYDTWLKSIHSIEDVITALREKKWTDELDSIDEDDDDILENKQVLLSEDDPRLLRETLEKDLEENFKKLRVTMQDHAERLRAEDKDSGSASHKAVFLLRIWRHITAHPPSTCPNQDHDVSFVPILHLRISNQVIQIPLSRCDRWITRSLRHNKLQARVLWEGEPQLPVLPSPSIFRFLNDVMRAMAAYGVDIWTSSATGILKRQVRETLALSLAKMPETRGLVNGHVADSEEDGDGATPDKTDSGETNEKDVAEVGESKSGENQADTQKVDGDSIPQGPSKEVVRDMTIQRLFDFLYLQNALRLDGSTALEDGFDGLQKGIVRSLELEDELLGRLRGDAEAYWKRTELLFGLLK